MKLHNLIGIALLVIVVSFIIAMSGEDKTQDVQKSAPMEVSSYTPSHPEAVQISEDVYYNTMGHDNFYDVINPKGVKNIFLAICRLPNRERHKGFN